MLLLDIWDWLPWTFPLQSLIMSERNSYCFLIISGDACKNSKELSIFDFILVVIIVIVVVAWFEFGNSLL